MRKKREWLTFDLTPLIDIVFLLLIFFMVFSVFKTKEFILDINLPTAQSSQKENQEKKISIELDTKNLSFQGEKVSFEELADKCYEISKKSLIVLSIDKKVQYERIVQLLDILKEKELENISLLVEK